MIKNSVQLSFDLGDNFVEVDVKVKEMSKEEEKECRRAFEEWNGAPLSLKSLQVWEGWRACYAYVIEEKKKELHKDLEEILAEIKKGREKLK